MLEILAKRGGGFTGFLSIWTGRVIQRESHLRNERGSVSYCRELERKTREEQPQLPPHPKINTPSLRYI